MKARIISHTSIFIKALLLTLLLLCSCGNHEKTTYKKIRKANEKGEYIVRKSSEYFYQPQAVKPQVIQPYPWESKSIGTFPRITKDFFQCKGSYDSPIEIIKQGDKDPIRHQDCGGIFEHTLPVKNGKEFIYPILIDLLNYLQEHFEKPVEITCGHRCPAHNTYADSRKFNLASKHQIGAEVDFYIIGMEDKPQRVVDAILDYYQSHPKYKGEKDYTSFSRYHKDNTDVSTAPWYNKEIFIKLYQKHEGRDKDNKHPYPYIGVQVRYDFDEQKSVRFNWDEAIKGYLRK
ncbi:MAG: hypothetical protein L7U87_01100 [Chlamydiales bacterium]|nr:hypothetical protein [Chlamydiales bacterium]